VRWFCRSGMDSASSQFPSSRRMSPDGVGGPRRGCGLRAAEFQRAEPRPERDGGGLCTCLDPWTTSGAQQWLQRWSRMPGGNSPNGCSPGWLSAADRHSVIHLLTTVPGTDVGGVPPTEPAEAGDERVDALVQGLDGQQWRRWSLARLSADLVGSLEAWRAEREALESDLRRLLDDH
jgi:hypothetical protein